MKYLLPALLLTLSFACKKTTPPSFDTSVDEFILQPGFAVQTLAAEPLLSTPVALAFDNKNRMWVAELTGYMRDIDGSDENVPDGKIVLLTDADGDGIADGRRVVLDSLQTPRTLLHAYGGLLYNDGASLFWAKVNDTDLGTPELIDSLYVVGGNIEHQPNGLLYHLDNWIYSANSTTRYRRYRGKWLREATTSRGQWGLSADPDGRLLYNNNSLPAATDKLMPNQVIGHDYQRVKYAQNISLDADTRLYGYQATAVNRGYLDGVLDAEGKVKNFTSACAPTVFTGSGLGDDFAGNLLVCAPEANLIKRYFLQDANGKKQAVSAYDGTEFLLSKDETFRPVNLYNAPDGSLYVLDMRKGVIQHRAYMTNYLREKILEKGLDTITGKGRIYRVFKEDIPPVEPFDFAAATSAAIAEQLTSPLPARRLSAQQQLIFRAAADTENQLKTIARDGANPYGQLHALWTLEGLQLLDFDLWQQLAAADNHPVVDETLLRFSAFFKKNELQKQLDYFQKIADKNDARLDLSLVLRLGKIPDPRADELLLTLAERNGNDRIFSEILISSIFKKQQEIFGKVKERNGMDTLQKMLKTVIGRSYAGEYAAPKLPVKTYKDDRTAGLELYNNYCSSCHGLDGRGKENLSPPLVDSEYVSGSTERLIALILHGMKGPVTVAGTRYELNAVMPGIGNNPDLSDKDIADLLIFLRNSFSTKGAWVKEEEVTKVRAQTAGRREMFTEEELSEL